MQVTNKHDMESILLEVLDRVERQYGIRLSVTKSRPGSVFPEINVESREVEFNPKLLSFLTLYNLLLQHPSVDSEAVTLFRLYNLYLDHDAYSQAGQTLSLLEKEVKRIKQDIRRQRPLDVMYSTQAQVLFVLLHEAAHAVFHYRQDVRDEYVAAAHQSVSDMLGLFTEGLPERMKDYMDSFIPGELPDEIRSEVSEEQYDKFKQYGRLIFDFSAYLRPGEDGKLEEFACDRFAWRRALAQTMEEVGMSGEATLHSNIDLLLTLHILDYDKALRSIFKGAADEEQVSLIRDAGMRHAVLRNSIWHFYKEIYPVDHSREFLKQSEQRDERAKRLLMYSTVNHAQDIHALRDMPFRLPEEEQIDALEKRFEEIESGILGLIGR